MLILYLKIKFYLRYILASNRLKIISPKNINSQFNIINFNNKCHIIGSGYSINKSFIDISKKDFVIGNNFACLSGIKFDLYFIEFYSKKFTKLSLNQKNAIDKYLNKDCKIIFKNSCNEFNNFKYLKKLYAGSLLILSEITINNINARYNKLIVENIAEPSGFFYIQIYTSILTSISTAISLGFKEIVIHGVDFGGSYFYNDESKKIDINCMPPNDNIFYNSVGSKEFKHSISQDNEFYNFKQAIFEVVHKAKSNNINIIAHEESKLNICLRSLD